MDQTSKNPGRPSKKAFYADRLLKKLRLQAGLTQVELAGKVGISQTALSSYEHGYEISTDHGLKILRVLNEILGRDVLGKLSIQDLSREESNSS